MTSVHQPIAGDDARYFGAESRNRLLQRYFAESSTEQLTSATAWRHLYRLLLWIDRTIGLAHCYESDKAQPGRPWYARSLRFHHWLSTELGVSPLEVGDNLDWMFTEAVRSLAASRVATTEKLAAAAHEQRREFESAAMPVPGENAELEELIEATLRDAYRQTPPSGVARQISEQVITYVSSENKRKNMVGEGFEDSLAAVLRRIPAISQGYDIRVRPPLHEVSGFHPPRGSDKTKRVDLVLVRKRDGHRVLVSCKWSIRSDREEQFVSDFDAYASLESGGRQFDYVLVTNEFDPARLAAACENRQRNTLLFSHVVHVNPAGLRAAYLAPTTPTRAAGGMGRAVGHIESGRLSSLEQWLTRLSD